MLDRGAIENATDLLEKSVPFAAHIAPHANLDQFMRFERDVDFMHHRARQSVRADRDDGMQMMRFGP